MTDAQLPIEAPLRQPRFQDIAPARWGSRLADVLIRSLVPVVLALVAGGILLAALGVNPFDVLLRRLEVRRRATATGSRAR